MRPLAEEEFLSLDSVRVTVAPDQMSASIAFTGARNVKGDVDESFVRDVMQMLWTKGIIFGLVSEQALRSLVAQGLDQPGKDFVVAVGKEPTEPEDERLDYLFEIAPKKAPRELPDGHVNYKELGLLQSARKGQALVRRLPGKAGASGQNVLGEAVSPRPPRPAALPATDTTEPDQDGQTLFAKLDGEIVVRSGGRVAILPVHEVSGDVDYAVGNIMTPGSVRVYGSVRSGFMVKAGGNIEVFGIVEAAAIEAAGDVVVHGGVQGSQKTIVRAGGTVRALYLQNATVDADGAVIVSDSVMHSNVRGRRLEVVARGLLVGGTVRVQTQIAAKVIGSEFATGTRLELGEEPLPAEQIHELERRWAEVDESVRKVRDALAMLQRIESIHGRLSAEQAELKGRLEATSLEEEKIIEALSIERAALRAAQDSTERPTIKVGLVMFLGVRVVCHGHDLQLDHELRAGTYAVAESGLSSLSQ